MAKRKPKKTRRTREKPKSNKPKPVVPLFEKGFWKSNLIPILILSVFAIGLYVQTYSFEHVLDDKIVITGNQYTKKGIGGIIDIFTTESFQGYFGEQKDLLPGSRYRPLSIASFALEVSLFGVNPVSGHIINMLLYLLTGVFLYRIFVVLFPPKNDKAWYFSLAFLAAIFFVIHPLHTEAVANVKGRDEILTLLGSLAALYSSLRYIDHKKTYWLVLSGLAFFIGLLAKENTITFLAIIPATLYFFTQARFKQIAISFVPILVATFLYLFIRYQVIGFIFNSGTPSNDLMNNPFLNMNSGEKYATIFYTLGLYFKLGFFPHPLTHDYYPFHIPTMNWGKPASLLSLGLYFVLGIIMVLGLRKKTIPSYALLFYLAPLSIVSNLFFTVGTFMNERFIFISSIGLCILMAYLLTRILPKVKPPYGQYLAYGLGALIIIGYTFKSFTRIPDWRSALSLNSSAVKVSKNSARVNTFMGTALYNEAKLLQQTPEKQQMLDQAERYVDKSISLFPRYYNANLMKAGIVNEQYKFHRNLDTLLSDFKGIVRRRPGIDYLHEYYDFLNNGGYDRQRLNEFYYDCGYNILYKNDKKYNWAIRYLKYAESLGVNDPKVFAALSDVYTAVGDKSNASTYAQRARGL